MLSVPPVSAGGERGGRTADGGSSDDGIYMKNSKSADERSGPNEMDAAMATVGSGPREHTKRTQDS